MTTLLAERTRELDLAAHIGSSLLAENEELKRDLELMQEHLEESRLNVDSATSQARAANEKCASFKKRLLACETKKDTIADTKEVGFVAHTFTSESHCNSDETDSALKSLEAEILILQQKLQKEVVAKSGLEIKLQDLRNEFKQYMQDEEIRLREELVHLRQEEGARAKEDSQKSAAYAQKQREVEELAAMFAQATEENEILVEQASELRTIITEKQFQKDEVVEQCRQIQMQTTMLLINAGKYDQRGNRDSTNSAETTPNTAPKQAVENSKKRKSLVQQVDEANMQRATEQAETQKRVQKEKREILQMLLSILRAHERETLTGTGSKATGLSMAHLSTHIKAMTGKGWGGHWGKRHGTLLQFLQKHPELFDANFRSGVTLRF